MRIILAAAAALAVNVYYLVEHFASNQISWSNVQSDPVVSHAALSLLFAMYFFFEGVVFMAKRKSGGSQKDNDALTKLVQDRDALRTAYEEAKERLKSAEALAQAKLRPRAIDTELVNLLSLFQEKGRLIDFLMDDITPYADAQVGAAARVVHQGCSAALREFFTISPVHPGKEGERITLEKQFSPKEYRMVGQVAGNPPYAGTVLHRGWKTAKVSVPRVTAAEEAAKPEWIIAPAEVEL
jgi:hypothetical protein